MDSLLIPVVLLCFAAGITYIVKLKRRLWFANYQIQNRDRERHTVFSFLNEIGERITKRVDLEETFELVVDFCMNATKADAGAIFVKDDDDDKIIQARVVQGLFPPLHETTTDKLISKRKYLADYVKKEKLRVGEGVIGLVAQTGEAILIPDASTDKRVPKSAGEIVRLEGLILAPLVVRGVVLGVLVLINKREDGQTFNEVDRDLVTALADQAAVTLDIVRLYEELAEKQRLEQELKIAHDFQALLLPREMPKLPEAVIHGFSQPALEVGGDYFDFVEVDEEHLGVVIGDVSGKGIPGALVMATLRSTLRAEAPGDLSPRAVLSRVNEHIMRDTKENVFITVTYGILNRTTGSFRFARAGHEPTITVSPEDSTVKLYSPNGIVLGLVTGDAFEITEEEEISAKDAGIVVLYTDGVPEAMNEQREEYGEKRFQSVLQRSAGTSPQQLIGNVMEDIGRFTGGIPQHDDITLVVMQWRGNDAA
ncbi:SpoIIE family protein phosphatase [bacterium]|nr:SpoIIE family protein phosphatase [bacterium]